MIDYTYPDGRPVLDDDYADFEDDYYSRLEDGEDVMDGDFDSAMESAGFGFDEQYRGEDSM